MEQTINLFSKGLQLDTNPMVLSNDSLSDALNATFITMNGNEVVLQNDMGNRRVDNTYLPPGYEPVGIKEYGGIIYIAAYNPITNKSLIGSFPSPERKISKSDDDNLGGTTDFIKDFRKSYKEEHGLYWLTSDTLLYPLTSKSSLHAGDKFVVYGFSNEELTENVTNYNNILDSKVLTSLNKTYTLLLGVLNSQNEFVDITKTLVRWDRTDNRIKFKGTETDLFKFNSGYFLAKGNLDNSDLHDTINDNNFITERLAQKLALNTYAYKLIGPMYLKAILNHIEEFNYSIRGTYDLETETTTGIANLTIEAVIKYNCPHKIDVIDETIDKANDEDYVTFDLGMINWDNFFDFYYTDKDWNNSEFIEPDNANHKTIPANRRTEPETFHTTYDKLTNLYTTKITKKYSNIRNDSKTRIIKEPDGDKIYFILGVCTPEMEYSLWDKKQIYLEGLSVIDVINLSLLGSGIVISKEWRFYNSNNTTELTYGLEVYPKEGYKLVNLCADFYEVTENTNWMQPSASRFLAEEVQNRNTITFNWKGTDSKNYGDIKPRKMYYVKLKYLMVDETGNHYYKYDAITKELVPGLSGDYIYSLDKNIWFLSTSLFNNSYKQSDKYYIKCYFDRRNKKEEENFKELCTVNIKLNPNDNITESEETKLTHGKLITSVPDDSDYIVHVNKNIKFTYNPNIQIIDPEKYPDNVTLAYNQVNTSYQTIYECNNIEFTKKSNGDITDKNGNKLIDIILNGVDYCTSPNYRKNNIDDNIAKITETKSSNLISIDIDSYNIFRAMRESSEDIQITNAFNNFYDTIEKNIVNKLIETEQGAGIVINYETGGNSCWIRLIHFYLTNSNNKEVWNKYDGKDVGGSLLSDKGYFDFNYCAYDHDDEYLKSHGASNYYTLLYNGKEVNTEFKNISELAYTKLNEVFPLSDSYSDFLFIFTEPVYINESMFQIDRSKPGWLSNIGPIGGGFNCEQFARVWWRASDGKWALMYSPLEMEPDRGGVLLNNRSNINYIKNTLIEYFKKVFKLDFIYCYINNTNAKEAGLYVPINYLYTRNYKAKINIYNKLSATINNTYISNGNFTSENSPLIFTNNTDLKANSLEYSYTIKCDEKFLDAVSVNFNTLNGIYIKTGLSKDLNGEELSKHLNEIYLYEENRGLKRILSSEKLRKLIKIERNENYLFNKVLYNSSSNLGESYPLHRYDWRSAKLAYGDFLIDYKDSLVTPEYISNE